MTRMSSDFLFASPSPQLGVARLIDLFGQLDLYNQSGTGDQADFHALSSDWGMVGLDLCLACQDFARTHNVRLWIEDGKIFAQIPGRPPEAIAEAGDEDRDALLCVPDLAGQQRQQDDP